MVEQVAFLDKEGEIMIKFFKWGFTHKSGLIIAFFIILTAILFISWLAVIIILPNGWLSALWFSFPFLFTVIKLWNIYAKEKLNE